MNNPRSFQGTIEIISSEIIDLETRIETLKKQRDELISKAQILPSDQRIEALNLSRKTFNTLRRHGFITISDVVYWIDGGCQDYIRNFGGVAWNELIKALADKGFLHDTAS